MTTIRFELDWIPPAKISGNKRGDWTATKDLIKEMRQSGIAHGMAYMAMPPKQIDWPLAGPLELRYTFYTKMRRDWVNLAFGMKAFEDGLEDAGIFKNDYQISRAIVERHKGDDRTIVEIRTLE